MRHAFFLSRPRTEPDEYEVYFVPILRIDEFREIYPTAVRLSRKQAVRFGVHYVRRARKIGARWRGGFAGAGKGSTNPFSPIPEQVEELRKFTVAMLDERLVTLNLRGFGKTS